MFTNQTILLQRRVANSPGRQHVHTRSRIQIRAHRERALADTDALDKARYFVLGCENLIIAVDHTPLLKLLADRALDDTPNPALGTSRRRHCVIDSALHMPQA